MTSDLKAATARANGAKSRGPKTADGLEKSSRNSLAHGLTSRHTILLDVESRAQFQEMLDDFDATYQPASPAQKKLVDEMVATRWRLDRLWLIETALLEDELRRLDQPTGDPSTGPDMGLLISQAFRSLADGSQALALVRRYQATLHRVFERSYRTLRELQKDRENKLAARTSQPEPAPLPQPQPEQPSNPVLVAARPEPVQFPRPVNQRLRNEPTDLRSARGRRRWLALFSHVNRSRRRAA